MKGSELLLYHDPETDVVLHEAESLTPIETTTDPHWGNENQVLLGRYRFSVTGKRPQIQPVPLSDRYQVDSATLIEQRTNGRWFLSTTLRFHDFAGPVSRFRIRIPRELAEEYQLQIGDAESRTKRRADGSIDVTVHPIQKVATELTLAVTAQLTAPADEWQLPLVTAADAEPNESYLLLRLSDVLRPSASTASRLRLNSLPDWIAASTSFDPASNAWAAYGSNSLPWKLHRMWSGKSGLDAQIPFVRTRIWLQRDAVEFGCSEFFLISTGGQQLDLFWRDGLKLIPRALFVDGKPVSPQRPIANSLAIPFDASAGPHRVTLYWSWERGQVAPRFGTLLPEIPRPRNVTVERSLLTLVSPVGSRVVTWDGLVKIDAVDHAADWLEGLLDVTRAQVGVAPNRQATQTALVQLYEEFNHRFSFNRVTADDGRPVSAQRARFSKIGDEIGTLRRIIDKPAAQPEKNSRSHISASDVIDPGLQIPIVADNRQIVYGRLPNDNRALSFWIVDDLIVTCALSLAGLLLIIPIAYQLAKLNLVEWVNSHQVAAWELLGLIWWTCLAPSFFGFLLVLVGAIFVVRRS